MFKKWGYVLPAVLVIVLVLSQGCMVGPDYKVPEDILSDQWHQEAVRGLSDKTASIENWWKQLNDPVLNELIEMTSDGNFDLKQAQSRVMQSRAELGIVSGEKMPAIDAIGEYFRRRESEGITPLLPRGLSRTDNFLSIGLSASWEVDLWGRVRRNIESAEYSLEASMEDLRDVQVILYADVAINYVLYRTLETRIYLANENIKRQEATLVLTSERFKAGLVPRLDVRQSELNLAVTRSVIPRLTEFLKSAEYRLSVLTGEVPGGIGQKLANTRSIPKPSASITVGIPADMVRQRPDIRSAERQLASQTARIGSAIALRYPQFSLLGDFVFDSAVGSFSGTFRQRNRAWSFGPSFTWSIFDGDRITSNIKFEEASASEAYLNYRQVVLEALEDVENSMVGYVQEQKRKDRLDESVTAAQDSVALVTTLYRTGLTDFQNVLDMERSLFAQQDELASSQGTVVVNLIRIYRSLGGGWTADNQGFAVLGNKR